MKNAIIQQLLKFYLHVSHFHPSLTYPLLLENFLLISRESAYILLLRVMILSWIYDDNFGSTGFKGSFGENAHHAKVLFLLVQRAYSVLSDPNKRAIYDRFGMMGLDVAENCNKDQQDYMSEFAQNSSWPILLTCLGLLTCCFCCYCCCGCCMFCRRDSIPQGLVKEKPKVKDESIIAGTIVGD
uniref:J domain-containing protein n=1 Tax=Heterorhabditis bacteriophora TaxID=37862 RepID=A0A1I7WVJ4_HETBA